LLDDLRRVGILHDSAASALAHLATIDDDPGAWWGSSRVQVARIAFADRFANFAPTWQDELERELSAHAR
jgi:putative transferase (TIGR04331 family)